MNGYRIHVDVLSPQLVDEALTVATESKTSKENQHLLKDLPIRSRDVFHLRLYLPWNATLAEAQAELNAHLPSRFLKFARKRAGSSDSAGKQRASERVTLKCFRLKKARQEDYDNEEDVFDGPTALSRTLSASSGGGSPATPGSEQLTGRTLPRSWGALALVEEISSMDVPLSNWMAHGDTLYALSTPEQPSQAPSRVRKSTSGSKESKSAEVGGRGAAIPGAERPSSPSQMRGFASLVMRVRSFRQKQMLQLQHIFKQRMMARNRGNVQRLKELGVPEEALKQHITPRKKAGKGRAAPLAAQEETERSATKEPHRPSSAPSKSEDPEAPEDVAGENKFEPPRRTVSNPYVLEGREPGFVRRVVAAHNRRASAASDISEEVSPPSALVRSKSDAADRKKAPSGEKAGEGGGSAETPTSAGRVKRGVTLWERRAVPIREEVEGDEEEGLLPAQANAPSEDLGGGAPSAEDKQPREGEDSRKAPPAPSADASQQTHAMSTRKESPAKGSAASVPSSSETKAAEGRSTSKYLEVKFEDLELLSALGEGRTAMVYRALWRPGGSQRPSTALSGEESEEAKLGDDKPSDEAEGESDVRLDVAVKMFRYLRALPPPKHVSLPCGCRLLLYSSLCVCCCCTTC